MSERFTVTLLLLLISSVAWAGPPPGPDDPLIVRVQPTEAQQGQRVRIEGFNFGNMPQVTFNGVSAPIIGERPDSMALYVMVPTGASSGPLSVTNTGTGVSSNAAQFIVATGTYTPACSIVGTVRDNTTAVLADTVIEAIDPASSTWVGIDFSEGSGNYSIGLPAAGSYSIRFRPPEGTASVEAQVEANCPGTMNHQFVVGSQLSATLLENQAPLDPVPNALIFVWPAGGGLFVSTVSDANGDLVFHVPDGTYNLFVIGPVGGRQISHFVEPAIVVSGTTSLGDIVLDIGWLVSGVARYQNDADTGLLDATANIELTDPQGGFAGFTYAIADGSFWLAARDGTDNTLSLWGVPGFLTLDLPSLDVTSDMSIDRPLTLYSSAAQVPTLPTIIETGFPNVQEAQPTYFRGLNLGGSSVSVRFPDGVGGWVDGDDTWVDPVRSLIGTRVPAAAASGNVHIRVDGVDGPGYPVTIAPGLHDPGSYTVSGTVTDGSHALEGIPVVLVHIDQCDDDTVIDFDVTDADGAYSVKHATGNHIVYPFPPVSSGLATKLVYLADLTGNTVSDVVLDAGNAMTGRVVDSGVGPVGATSAPIPNSLIEVEANDIWAEDWVQSDESGLFAMNLVASSYEVWVEGPSESRYLSYGLDIGSPADLGDIQLDSGYFVEGYVVDETGAGVPGIEVSARDTSTGDYVGSAMTVGDTGRFRMAVYDGVYDIDFWVPPTLDYIVEPVTGVDVSTDVLLYPKIEAETAAHVEGTVYLADGITPVPDTSVDSQDPVTWDIIRSVRTCQDGTYDLRVAPGDYLMHAWPGLDYPCLSREFHSGTYYICDAEPVAVGLPDPTTGIDFTLDPAGSISGRVVDDSGAGVPEAWVCVDEGPGGPTCFVHCVSTFGDGRYLLENAPVGGGNRVRMTHPSLPTECWDGHTGCTDYDPVSVDYCTETQGINFGPSTGVPGPVPDGAYVPGVPLTASYDPGSGTLTVNWQPTCDAAGHALYVGGLGEFGTYTWAACNIGTTGTYDFPAPSGSFFFLVVGNTWPNEGSYGRDGDGVERPSAAGQHCGYTQDLGYDCVP